ncbi:F-type H+-transporting ATPase subunit b [Monoraphidium neglectum]|uniref:F-type H+-transporting ATPase subunit b n=1 Tax=Monoraphidium neglectum TaxID=145388 RepID=A0A0D2M309_9CHLO|nr:F-type H+-transporting ATPase subunit b [Monoraphidium neglectum]KIY97994.1 F-type H+-transporting ATPase subunit b [Monoraphidium neglectum]|eukprot:XP_013897014.1 F-type H+-transporting ATPase subunit b [Monoraphidium neglectum]
MALSLRSKAFGATQRAAVRTPTRAVRMVVRASAQQQQQSRAQLAKAAMTAAGVQLIAAAPAFAEAGKLFDFNLTLPIMAGEILLLMVFLDKTWFGPVGKVLDERDATLRSQLTDVKGNAEELAQLTKEAEELVRAARGEVSALVLKQKNAKQAELDKLYNEAKAKITKETESAIAAMEKESEALLASLDAQAEKISTEVLRRVLPEGVKI